MPSYTDSHFSCDRYPFPTVHLGGTGRETLLKGYSAARDAVADALAASIGIELHPRDYPCGEWDKARAERTRHHDALRVFLGHLTDHIESLYETTN